MQFGHHFFGEVGLDCWVNKFGLNCDPFCDGKTHLSESLGSVLIYHSRQLNLLNDDASTKHVCHEDDSIFLISVINNLSVAGV